jgi:predicted nucleotidyltransferase
MEYSLCYYYFMNIEAHKPQIAEVAQKYNLDFVVLFGSQATGRTHPKSDVDIGVISHGEVDRLKLMNEMDKILGREDVTVVDLGMASPTLMRAIVVDGKLLYERERAMFLKWKFYAIRTWMETDWLRRLARKNLIEWATQLS